MALALSLLGRYWPVLGALVLLIGAYQAGVNAERKRGEAAQLRVEIQTMRRDKAIADAALVRVTNDAVELEALRRTDEEKIDQLQTIIRASGRPGLTQSELDGLLGIQ